MYARLPHNVCKRDVTLSAYALVYIACLRGCIYIRSTRDPEIVYLVQMSEYQKPLMRAEVTSSSTGYTIMDRLLRC